MRCRLRVLQSLRLEKKDSSGGYCLSKIATLHLLTTSVPLTLSRTLSASPELTMHFSPFLLALAMCSITSPATVKAEERLANQVRSASEPVELRGLNRHERAAEKRAACSHDNVLRALLANSARASVFCSTYIHIGVTSVYVPGTTPVTT